MSAVPGTGVLAGMIVSLTVVSTAHGGVIPPPWTPDPAFPETVQLWDFYTMPDPYVPSFCNNPNGWPVISFPRPVWLPNNPMGMPGTGVLVLNDSSPPLKLHVPNYNLSMRKQIFIVIKFSSMDGAGVPFVDEIMGMDGSFGQQKAGYTPTPSPVPGMPGVMQIAYLWNMPTCRVRDDH